MLKLYWIAVLAALPLPAFAYLDPASGNALVYLAVSLFGAAAYFVKSAFYRTVAFFKGEKYVRTEDLADIVIFSEGKSYWLSYKPIIEALIEKKIHFRYLTMEVTDPALMIDNEFMHSKYVGEGAAGFARVARTKAPVMPGLPNNVALKPSDLHLFLEFLQKFVAFSSFLFIIECNCYTR